MSVWGQRSAFVLQLLNLTCVLGFMASPLLAKPFLHTAATARDDDDDDDAVNNSTECSGRNSSAAAAAVTSSCGDVTVTSSSCGDVTVMTSHQHGADVTRVFVIVALYSLLVELLIMTLCSW